MDLPKILCSTCFCFYRSFPFTFKAFPSPFPNEENTSFVMQLDSNAFGENISKFCVVLLDTGGSIG